MNLFTNRAARSARAADSPRRSRRCTTRPLAALLLLFVLAAADAQAQHRDEGHWIASWTASPQPVWDANFALPANVPERLQDRTVRQIARVSLGGRRVRVLLSNEYGEHPLVVGAVHVALAGNGAAVVPESDRALTFGGSASATIPPGAPALSDPVDLPLPVLSSVAVSLYLPQSTGLSTFHWDGRQTAHLGRGDQAGSETLDADATLTARLFLAAILVDAPADAGAVVAFGDSITDGAMATTDANRRWPDRLAERLAPRNVAVLNAGISGARVLRDKMGANALARFERDVLAQPGVRAAVVLMGINDLAWNGTIFAPGDPPLPAEELIAGYRQLIARARARGVRIVGATLTPFEGALQDSPMRGYYGADKERVRQRVNAWMRESGEFDALLDFDAVTRDPAHPARFLPAYDSGDHLHPGDAGYKAMADSIDPSLLLGEPAAPTGAVP